MENIKIYIVIPAYNEATIIQNVIAEIKNTGYENIIVIDDGSFDNTYEKAGEIENITVLRHKINRGKGAAAKTGIEAAKLLGADIIVTMDSDGQHDPKNIENLVDPIINEKFDAVLGTRLINPKGMPLHKILHNKIANLITWYLYGLWVTDSQSGFRAVLDYDEDGMVNIIDPDSDNDGILDGEDSDIQRISKLFISGGLWTITWDRNDDKRKLIYRVFMRVDNEPYDFEKWACEVVETDDNDEERMSCVIKDLEYGHIYYAVVKSLSPHIGNAESEISKEVHLKF